MAARRASQAEAALMSALGKGDEALCHLGLGVVAFGRSQWDAAAREFTDAHDAGGPGAAAAEYGLAAVLFNQGKTEEFEKAAGPLLAGAPDVSNTPNLLHGMEAVAIEGKRWPEARAVVGRLVDQFPRHPVTPEALAELVTAAG